MQLKETAFAYNVTTDGHSNSDWGAEIGQGNKKLMNVDGVSEILNGMLYYKVDNIDDIEAILGKGNRTPQPLSSYLPDTSIVVASVFEKVRVNGKELAGQKFIMFVTKDERKMNNKGEPNIHYQRRGLKFSDKAIYKGETLNQNCINAISRTLGCSQNGSWIVTNIDFIDDELCFTAVVVDKNNPYDFPTKNDRSEFLKRVRLQRALGGNKATRYQGGLEPVILYGPPGTGKTFSLQTDYQDYFEDNVVEFTTFHQSFSYEEFVEGLKPSLGDSGDDISYNIEKGVFYNACEKAAIMAGYDSIRSTLLDSEDERKKKFTQAVEERRLVLLCIDEINRGNVASIFGDLISLIEPSKRLGADNELILTLPYSKERFGVPANLLIVGTMNTADRSIQLLDSALRRRFRFEELPPLPEKIKYEKARNLISSINNRVRALLNKDSQIGHAYFMGVEDDKQTFDILIRKIIPLLEEYFYNDIDKIKIVLNDKGNDNFYKEDKEAKREYDKYAQNEDINSEEKNFYSINPEIFTANIDIEKYLSQVIGE